MNSFIHWRIFVGTLMQWCVCLWIILGPDCTGILQ